jgi:hemoglobin
MRAPHPQAPGTLVGISEPMICKLVHTFYARVRADPLLGPIFNGAIHDWDAHLEKLCAFWSSVTLMTGRYKGTPIKVHADLPQISAEHFERWLALFQETAAMVCPESAAQVFVDRAKRIAQSLQLSIALHRGEALALAPASLAKTGSGAKQDQAGQAITQART